MDKIQKALVKLGRNDLAQEYYLKVSGKSRTIKYIIKTKEYSGRKSTPMEWEKSYGRANDKNLKKFVEDFNESIKSGVNKHISDDSMISNAEIVEQSTGKTLAKYKAPSFKVW